MTEGSWVATFLIVFREALEASLIVGIIMTALARLNQTAYFRHVIASSAAGVAASIAAGVLLLGMVDSVRGRAQEILEGSISILACGVLTYMVFWMEQQARKIKPDIEAKIESAVSRGEYLALITLPFLAVLREGAETVLFLQAVASQSGGAVSAAGCVSGLALAVTISWLLFVGGRKIPLKPLFRVSGIFLLLVAAGLLAYGIHEFHEAGIIPEIYAPVWDMNSILNEKKGLGSFLKALFGYNGNPSLVEVTAYGLYLLGILYAIRRVNRSAQAPR